MDSGSVTYTYDAAGDRARKDTGSNWTEYVRFGGSILAENHANTGNGQWTDYIFANGMRLAAATTGNPTSPSTTTTYYGGDQIGSARILTNGSGGTVESYEYYPYGQGPTPDSTNHYLFTGKERDSESGNDYFKYRYYASSMGRWLSPDPSGLRYANLTDPQSLNLYSYVGNRPLTLVDLEGLCWKGFQWACDAVNEIKNLAVEAKNKVRYGEWTTNTAQAKIRSVDRYEAKHRNEEYQKETAGNASQNRLLENSAYSLTAFHPISVMTVVVDGVPIPIASLGVSGTVTYIPKHNTWCIGGAVGIQTGAGKSLTGTFYPSYDAAHTEAVVSDTGWNYNAQPTQFSGLSVNQNSSGTLMGYSVASDSGASGAYGYTKCADF